MKKFFLVLCFLIAGISLVAQSKFQVNLDYHYNLGILEKSKDLTLKRNLYKMHGNSLRLVALYALSERLSLGAGMGADRYEEPGYNTFPVFAAARFSPVKKHPPFYLYTNLGYALKGNVAFYGALWEAGAGYKHMFRKHFGLKFDIGYNLKNFRDTAYDFEFEKDIVYSSLRHSISIGLGLIF